jgi:hypothetical protein
MTMNDYSDGIAYLTVRKDPKRYRKLAPVKVTNKPPTTGDANSVVIKLHLRVPTAAFEPLTPSAVVTVPAELVQHVVEVEAQ